MNRQQGSGRENRFELLNVRIDGALVADLSRGMFPAPAISFPAALNGLAFSGECQRRCCIGDCARDIPRTICDPALPAVRNSDTGLVP